MIERKTTEQDILAGEFAAIDSSTDEIKPTKNNDFKYVVLKNATAANETYVITLTILLD